MRRAQAAIEFLITNGWAILVVVILLAVLFYIGVLSPQNTTPNTCLFQPGFSCYTFKVGNGTGSLELDFGQATGKSIQVTGISCSQNATAALHTFPLTEDITVPSGEHRWITGGTSPNTGIACEGATAGAGARYKGTACVSYTESGTNTQRLVCGDINARLEPASIPSGSPTAMPYPTPPPGAVQVTDCSSSPIIISSPGYYYLNSSLTSNSGGDCIDITTDASNSILDCYGKTINSTNQWSGLGIDLESATNVTVRHCTVTNFGDGIRLDSSNYNTITDNTASSNQYGIRLIVASNNNLTGNTASLNSAYGVVLGSSSNNNLTDNIAIANSGNGIYVDSFSSNNLLTGNTACWNIYDNIYCDAGQNDLGGNICTPYDGSVCSGSITCHATCPPPPSFLISDCSSSPYSISLPGYYYLDSDLNASNYNDCIDFYGSGSTLDCKGHSITGTSPSSSGISLNSVSGVTVENCNVSNFGFGIVLQGAGNDNIFMNNTANSNYEGIALWWGGASNNIFIGNTASGNADSGIYLGSSSNNNLTGNTALGNLGYGIFLGSANNNNFTDNSFCLNSVDIYCDSDQNDSGGNKCMPEGSGSQCSSIYCNSGCPPLSSILISDCSSSPYSISLPGYYYLDSDLNSTGSDCIDFNGGSGSTLDCQNHSITGTAQSGNGISLNSVSGVTIENCNVSNFGYGIMLQGASNNNILTNNTANSNSEGIALWWGGASNNIFIGNTASGNADSGFYLGSAINNSLTGNTALGNLGYGIYLGSSSNNNFTTNTACWNQGGNVYCDAGQNDEGSNICTPYGGTVCSDSITCNSGCPPPPSPACAPGWVVSSCGCTLNVPGNYTLDSDLNSTSGDCIDIYPGADGSTLDCQNHTIMGIQSGSGISLLNGVSEVTVENCNVSNFTYGIYLQSSSNNTLTTNTACWNMGDVYCDSPQNDGTGNICMPSGGTACLDSIYCNSGCPPPPHLLISDCSSQYSIYFPGYYYLDSDLNATGDCIDFYGGSGSTLDCRGHNITGIQSGSGISLYGVSGVTVENCTVSNFNNGIYLQSASNNNFTGNTACWNANNINCDSTQNGEGNDNICMPYGETACLDSITCNSGCPPPTPVLISSCPYSISFPGYYYLDSDLNTTGNECIDFYGSGSTLDCKGHSITGTSKRGNGISLYSASGVTVENCSVSNFNTAIMLSSSNNNNLITNTAFNNSDGIYLSGASNNTLTGNTVSSNSYYGIHVWSSINNSLMNNNACSNPYGDFYCDSTQPDNGGNTCGAQSGCGITCGTGCPAPPEPPACASGYVVNSCPCILYPAGSYTLNSTLSSSGNCITMPTGASGSTLDCQHHSITGTSRSGNGITLEGVSGVTVRDCNVANFWNGIYLLSSINNNLTGNTANSNGYYGVELWVSDNNSLTGNNVSSNTYGIELYYSDNNRLTGNIATSNTYGISLALSDSNDFTGNSATGNSGGSDFYCGSSPTNNDLGNTCGTQIGCLLWLYTCAAPPACSSSITGCCTINSPGSYSLANGISSSGDCIMVASGGSGSTLDCDGHSITGTSKRGNGISLGNANGVTVLGCNVSNFRNGIYLFGSNGNTITGNTANSNYDGIYLSSSSDNDLTGNNASKNSEGIYLSSSNHNTLTGNTVLANNGEGGIYLDSSSSNALIGNNLSSNGYGISFYSSSNNTLTANTANSNYFSGILLGSSSNYNTLTTNTANSNHYCGFCLGGSSNNNFTSNTATSNSPDFSCGSNSNNDLGGNTCDSTNCGWLCSCPTNTCP